MIRVGKPIPIFDLFPPESAKFITKESEKEGLALLQQLNREHQQPRRRLSPGCPHCVV